MSAVTIEPDEQRRRPAASDASWVWLLVLGSVWGLACDSGTSWARLEQAPTSMFLNRRLEFVFDEALAPLSVTGRSVSVEDAEGRALPVSLDVARGALGVQLVIDAPLLEDPPSHVVVRLTGGPSRHGLTLVDGRSLERTTRVRVPVEGGLRAGRQQPPRLLSVGGHDLPLEAASIVVGSPMTLTFDLPLDPASLRPDHCPLQPVAQGVTLRPVLPRLEWRCIGDQFELHLLLDDDPGPVRLDLRRFAIRGLSGSAPEPAVVVDLERP